VEQWIAVKQPDRNEFVSHFYSYSSVSENSVHVPFTAELVIVLSTDKRLANISIWIGSSSDTMELCSYYGGPGAMGETVQRNCSFPMTGQYLKLTGESSDSSCDDDGECLRFSEIDVMGYFPGICAWITIQLKMQFNVSVKQSKFI